MLHLNLVGDKSGKSRGKHIYFLIIPVLSAENILILDTWSDSTNCNDFEQRGTITVIDMSSALHSALPANLMWFPHGVRLMEISAPDHAFVAWFGILHTSWYPDEVVVFLLSHDTPLQLSFLSLDP